MGGYVWLYANTLAILYEELEHLQFWYTCRDSETYLPTVLKNDMYVLHFTLLSTSASKEPNL